MAGAGIYSLRVVLLCMLLGWLLPGVAQAKRFQHYPGSDEQEKKKQASARKKPAPVPSSWKEAKDEPWGDATASPDANGRRAENATRGGDSNELNGNGSPSLLERSESASTGRGLEEEIGKEPATLLGPFLHGRGGIGAEYIYTGEVFTNTHGGKSTQMATDYMGLMDLAMKGDLEKLQWFPGGDLFLLAQNTHGHGISYEYVGDYQLLSNIDAPNRMQVSEYWWQHNLMGNEALTFRLGKQDCNAQFAVVDVAGDFCNSSFGCQPNIPMPRYPDPSMGASVFYNPKKGISLGAGVWDGLPDGTNWGFSNTGETFSILQAGAKWSLDDRLPGDFQAGGWFHSAIWPDVTETFDIERNYGYYLGWEQMIFKESRDTEDDQGLGVFFQYSWAPADRNLANHYIGSGLVYKGLFSSRDKDVTGAGVALVLFTDQLPGLEPESSVEVFHKFRLKDYFMVQPDLQYISHPSGIYRDSLTLGLRFEVVF